MQKIVALQYNPDTLTRSLQVKGAGESSGKKSEAMGPKRSPDGNYKTGSGNIPYRSK
jgi:hypothetical protein